MVAKIDNETLIENNAFSIGHATIHSLPEDQGARVTWDTTAYVHNIKPGVTFFFNQNGDYRTNRDREYCVQVTGH
jgi:hypothetical protein